MKPIEGVPNRVTFNIFHDIANPPILRSLQQILLYADF